MPNVLVVPVSGAIFFDRNAAGASTVAALNSAVRLNYDNGGGLNITSYTTALTALNRFTVDGAQGRLFSVSDALTGSLMSVNDITGLPILEVLDTDTVVAGAYNTSTFIVSGTRIAIGRTIDSTAKVAISGNTTVSGVLSTNNIITALGGNSNAWNSTYTTTNTNSAAWSLTSLAFAASDEQANITTGDAKIIFTVPQSFTLTKIKGGLNTAATGSSLIFSLSSQTNNNTAGTVTMTAGAVVADTAVSYACVENDRMCINVTQVGSTMPGVGLKVYLIGRYI
jgi:hypothetical protein